MHFKHPEILYFLFLLIIPIIVHLFQLRRFKKQYFTNVRFLKQLAIQTRKSSKIKKWLLLATRLLLLTFLILAFAQPFFTNKNSAGNNSELFIVLDNSFSMQGQGENGELLKRAAEDLLTSVPNDKKFSLLTNNLTFWNTDIKAVKADLQQLKYSSEKFRLDAALAKIQARPSNFSKDIVVITDGLGLSNNQLQSKNDAENIYFVIPKNEKRTNIAIDSAYITKTLDEFYEIAIKLTPFGDVSSSLPIALYDQNKLIGKTQVSFESEQTVVNFTIPKKEFHGYAEIIDNSLEYDNRYYFSITKPKLIDIISIGAASKSDFLSKIYTKAEFNYSNSELASLNYNVLTKFDVIILNELDEVPQALQVTLKSFVSNGGNVIFIPSERQKPINSNQFFSNFGKLQFTELQSNQKPITRISFSHPLYNGVFEKKIDNFQYPTTSKSYGTVGASTTILGYEDQSVFLTAMGNSTANIYVFTAPLNKQFSNFQNSPLIVPTFYNMAQSIGNTGIQSQLIGSSDSFVADIQISKDDIITIKNEQESFIPIQQISSNRVQFSFNQMPQNAGNYQLYTREKMLGNISFNYPRTESNVLESAPSLANFTVKDSIDSTFDTLHYDAEQGGFWRIFLLLTLLFLVIELLIQKFVK